MRSDNVIPRAQLVDLYHDSLQASLDDPEEFLTTLTRRVQAIIPIVGLVLVSEPRKTDEAFRNQVETIETIRMREGEGDDLVKTEATGWISNEEKNDLLSEMMARGLAHITQIADKRFPDRLDLITHWITIEHYPRIAVCFFRPHMADNSFLPFTKEELRTIEALTPHLSIIVRQHIDIVQSRRGSFDYFAERCHLLATEFGLTLQEFRVLRLLVTGSSNAEIGEETGTTSATIKTHITHILQKTGCRNRAALIGRYFSSRSTIKI